LLGAVVVVMTGVVVVGAFRARGSAAFNWWVGWASPFSPGTANSKTCSRALIGEARDR
jgi:hypothetical protein